MLPSLSYALDGVTTAASARGAWRSPRWSRRPRRMTTRGASRGSGQGTVERRTNLLPVLALVLRHGAAEDVILRWVWTGTEGGQTFGLERRGSIGRGDGGSRENISNTLQIAGFPVIDTSRRKTGRGTPPAAANALPARDPMRREVAKPSRVAGKRESARLTASFSPSPGRRASKRKTHLLGRPATLR